jgi:hypothetical protein
MGLINSGIEKVRVFELPSGVWGDGGSSVEPRRCLVKWRSVLEGKSYQVYVNSEYAGGTVDGEQRQMIVHLPACRETAARIEVFAVEAADIYTDFSDEVGDAGSGTGRVKISLLRGQDLPIGAAAEVFFDSGTGEIDYDNPLTEEPIRVWPSWQDKCGFGLGSFGPGDFGYESAAAVGLGRGTFGRGQFGLDADVIEWVSGLLEAGIYKFGVRATDGAGNESGSAETGQITVTPAAKPAEHLSISSFDKQTNHLVLSIS